MKRLLKWPAPWADSGTGGNVVVDYEYARRRYEWSKRLNLPASILPIVVGAVALFYGFLAYGDWVWLNQHFGGVTDPVRWTPDKIAAKLTTAVALMAVGGLGLAAGAIGLLFVRKSLDEDKIDAVKRWSFMAGILGIAPGLVVGGLLEFFIWRSHAQESFTMFGLLGSPPAAAAAPTDMGPSPAALAAQVDAQKKAEYLSLFAAPAPVPAYAPTPSPGYYASPQTQASDYAYAQAEPAPAPAPAADTGTQYAAQPSGAPVCSCGRTMEWVAEYNRYYCYTDDKYEGET